MLSSTTSKDPACARVRQTPSGIASLLQVKANTGLLCSNIFLGAVVGAPCVFPSLVAGVNITSCTKIDGDEVYNDLEIANFSASNRKFKRKQTVQN